VGNLPDPSLCSQFRRQPFGSPASRVHLEGDNARNAAQIVKETFSSGCLGSRRGYQISKYINTSNIL